jgi:hypothetical protein
LRLHECRRRNTVVESGENDDCNIVSVAGSFAGSQHQLFGSTVSTASLFGLYSYIFHSSLYLHGKSRGLNTSIAQFNHNYSTNFLAITATSRLIYSLKSGSETPPNVTS